LAAVRDSETRIFRENAHPGNSGAAANMCAKAELFYSVEEAAKVHPGVNFRRI